MSFIYSLSDSRWVSSLVTYESIQLNATNGAGGAAVGAAASRLLKLKNNNTEVFGVDLQGNAYGKDGIFTSINSVNLTPYSVVQPSSGNFRGSGASNISTFVTQFLRSDQNAQLNSDGIHHFSTDPSSVAVLSFASVTSGEILTINFTWGVVSTSIQATVQPGDTGNSFGIRVAEAIRSNSNLYTPGSPPDPTNHMVGGGYSNGKPIGYTVQYQNGLAFDYDARTPMVLSYSFSGASTTSMTISGGWFSHPANYDGGTTGGSANAQTANATGFTLSAGKWIRFTAGFTNSGAATLNVNSLGAIAFRKTDNNWPSGALSALSGNEIIAGLVYTAVYDGTFFRLHQSSIFINNFNTESVSTTLPNYLDNNPVYVRSREPGFAPPTGSIVDVLYSTGPTTRTPTTRSANYGVFSSWVVNPSYSGSSDALVYTAFLMQPGGPGGGWWFGQGIWHNSGGAPFSDSALRDMGPGSINLPAIDSSANSGIWFDKYPNNTTIVNRIYYSRGSGAMNMESSQQIILSASSGIGINVTPSGSSFYSNLGLFVAGSQQPSTGTGFSARINSGSVELKGRNYGSAVDIPVVLIASNFTFKTTAAGAIDVTIGVADAQRGSLFLANTASGSTQVLPGATGTNVLTLPIGTQTLIGNANVDKIGFLSGGSGTGLLTYSFFKQTVDFNATGDTVFAITLPVGFTRYRANLFFITRASGTLTTATVAAFTAAGGGGSAITTNPTAVTINTAAENTNNNAQQVNITNGVTQTFELATQPNIYFRVITPQGSAATADVLFCIIPVP